MPAPRRWIRLDTGWSRTEWLAGLEPAARLAWVELLTYAKTDGQAGIVKAIAPAVFGRTYGIPAADVAAMLAAATAGNDPALIVEDGAWIVVKWPDYQETDPTAAERQKRFRADRSRLSQTAQNRSGKGKSGAWWEGLKCNYCGATSDLVMDHIKPVVLGGKNEPSNYQVLCRPCNTKKGDRDDTGVTVKATSTYPVTRDNRDIPLQPVTGGVTRRVTETETEIKEGEADADASGKPSPQSFPQSAGADADLSDGDLMAIVRKRFYVPDGKPPTNYQEGREFSCFKYLRKQGRSGREIADRIEGAALIRDAGGFVTAEMGRVDWLDRDTKITMRALVDAKSGVTQLWQLAEIKLAASSSGRGQTAFDNGRVKIAIL